MRITYHALADPTGVAYSGGTPPFLTVAQVSAIGDHLWWSGSAWAGTAPDPAISMVGTAPDYHYDIPSVNIDPTLNYIVNTSGDGILINYITATGAELLAMFPDLIAAPPADAYATTSDLATYLDVTLDGIPTGSGRMLLRAKELIDYVTLNKVDTALPAHVNAVRSASCAQVEFWVEKGEDADVAGPNEQYSAGKHFNVQQGQGNQRVAPTYLAPRAARALQTAGLLFRGVSMT